MAEQALKKAQKSNLLPETASLEELIKLALKNI
jgi:hypothetical protein